MPQPARLERSATKRLSDEPHSVYRAVAEARSSWHSPDSEGAHDRVPGRVESEHANLERSCSASPGPPGNGALPVGLRRPTFQKAGHSCNAHGPKPAGSRGNVRHQSLAARARGVYGASCCYGAQISSSLSPDAWKSKAPWQMTRTLP